MSIPVREFMTPMPHTIGHDIEVKKAKAMMAEYNCNHLPVLDGGELVGVISSTDLKLTEKLASGDSTPVEEIMTDEPVMVEPDTSIKSAVEIMLKNNIHSVIVRAKGESPWGIFTSNNALEYFASKS